MKLVNYLAHTMFWLALGVVCLVIFFPLAIFPLVFWVMDMVALGNYYTRREIKKQQKLQKKMIKEMRKANTRQPREVY